MKQEQCKVCVHKQIDELNADIISGLSLRRVGEKYHLAKSTVARHKAVCMARDFALVREIAARDLDRALAEEDRAKTSIIKDETMKVLSGKAIAEKLNEVMVHAEEIRDLSMAKEHYGTALSALDTIIKGVREYTKLASEAREAEKMREDSLRDEWSKIKAILIEIFDKIPEAREIYDARISSIRSTVFN